MRMKGACQEHILGVGSQLSWALDCSAYLVLRDLRDEVLKKEFFSVFSRLCAVASVSRKAPARTTAG